MERKPHSDGNHDKRNGGGEVKPYTLTETIKLWASQYDWSVLIKVKQSVCIGICLGGILDLLIWFAIKL